MYIRRYKIDKIKSRQAIKVSCRIGEGMCMNAVLERHCTPNQSLREALKEMKLMREGKAEKQSFWDMIEELDDDEDDE